MNDGFSGAAGYAFFKLYGLKATLGMLGAVALYIVMPPKRPDGSYNEREFVSRLAIAGLFSCMFGDWVLQLLITYAPMLHADSHAKAVDLMTGAPGWWISRAIALWFYRRQDKDLAEVIKDVRESA